MCAAAAGVRKDFWAAPFDFLLTPLAFGPDLESACAFQNQIKTSPKYIAMQKVKLEQSWRDTQAKTLPEAESIHWGEQTVSPIAIYRLVPPRCRVCVGVGVRAGGGSGRVSAAAPVRPSCAGLSLSRLALVTLTWPPDQPRGLVLFPTAPHPSRIGLRLRNAQQMRRGASICRT